MSPEVIMDRFGRYVGGPRGIQLRRLTYRVRKAETQQQSVHEPDNLQERKDGRKINKSIKCTVKSTQKIHSRENNVKPSRTGCEASKHDMGSECSLESSDIVCHLRLTVVDGGSHTPLRTVSPSLPFPQGAKRKKETEKGKKATERQHKWKQCT